jgi:cytochrome b
VPLPGLSWWTGKREMMDWHYRSGIVFRLVWGLIGSSTARFSSFVRGLRAISPIRFLLAAAGAAVVVYLVVEQG